MPDLAVLRRTRLGVFLPHFSRGDSDLTALASTKPLVTSRFTNSGTSRLLHSHSDICHLYKCVSCPDGQCLHDRDREPRLQYCSRLRCFYPPPIGFLFFLLSSCCSVSPRALPASAARPHHPEVCAQTLELDLAPTRTIRCHVGLRHRLISATSNRPPRHLVGFCRCTASPQSSAFCLIFLSYLLIAHKYLWCTQS